MSVLPRDNWTSNTARTLVRTCLITSICCTSRQVIFPLPNNRSYSSFLTNDRWLLVTWHDSDVSRFAAVSLLLMWSVHAKRLIKLWISWHRCQFSWQRFTFHLAKSVYHCQRCQRCQRVCQVWEKYSDSIFKESHFSLYHMMTTTKHTYIPKWNSCVQYSG